MINPKYPTIYDLNQEEFMNELRDKFGKDIVDEIEKKNTHQRTKTIFE